MPRRVGTDGNGVMMKVTSIATAVAIWASAGMMSTAYADDNAQGTWRLSNGDVTVRIAPCGGRLCGYVVALARPLDKAGKPKVDHENPNPSLRSRPVMGLQILSNMQAKRDGSWTGTIYNADDGNTYSAYLSLQGGSTMKVKACVGPFCKTKMFMRVN